MRRGWNIDRQLNGSFTARFYKGCIGNVFEIAPAGLCGAKGGRHGDEGGECEKADGV